jgi:hypothetical protein
MSSLTYDCILRASCGVQKAVKGKRGGASTSARMTNWRLLDKKTMLVEMEWQVRRTHFTCTAMLQVTRPHDHCLGHSTHG